MGWGLVGQATVTRLLGQGAVDPSTPGVCSESTGGTDTRAQPQACQLPLGRSPKSETNNETIGKREMTIESAPFLYIVAEMANDGLTFGWTSAVFADPSDALNEQADAHDAGLMGEQVWELRRCRQLVPMLTPVGQRGATARKPTG